jgi:hypothetical protein
MEEETFIINYGSDISDETIHKLAVSYLLGRYDSELILNKGDYSYQVVGGNSGYLRYKKGNTDKWVSIADWCLYGLYMVVRYRKPDWLRPMYINLFGKMNFNVVKFDDYSIELLSSNGQVLRSRRFRLSPPKAFNKVMSEEFGFSKEQISALKSEMDLV